MFLYIHAHTRTRTQDLRVDASTRQVTVQIDAPRSDVWAQPGVIELYLTNIRHTSRYVHCSVLQSIVVCCSMLQCNAVRCSVS